MAGPAIHAPSSGLSGRNWVGVIGTFGLWSVRFPLVLVRTRESGFFLDFFLFSTDRRILPAQTSPHRQPGPAPGLRQPVHTTHCTRMQAPATFDIPETTRPEGEPTSTSLLRPMPTDAVTPLTPRTRLHAGWDDGSTPVPGYRRCPVHARTTTSQDFERRTFVYIVRPSPANVVDITGPCGLRSSPSPTSPLVSPLNMHPNAPACA